jgi:rhomboid protease GluP
MYTLIIIAVNVLVYLWLAYLSGNFLEISDIYIYKFGLSKESFLAGQYWQILTSMFIHFDLPHIGYNTIFLAIFGLKGEELYGKKLPMIYLASGIVAASASFLYPAGSVSGGASGAIFGVLGANLIAQRNLYSGGIWTSLGYGFIFFILAASKSTGFLAHLVGLVFGFIVGFWITREQYIEEVEEEELDEEAVRALEEEMARGL